MSHMCFYTCCPSNLGKLTTDLQIVVSADYIPDDRLQCNLTRCVEASNSAHVEFPRACQTTRDSVGPRL